MPRFFAGTIKMKGGNVLGLKDQQTNSVLWTGYIGYQGTSEAAGCSPGSAECHGEGPSELRGIRAQ
ncbi:hypothetical protein FQN55_006502 [Onygenales sp. PD_40]|nr:hypothetical protein FQN55_006502 [Onygenales sp. PD_40]KAK2779108.1 hypothetical protein FQN53_001544 [Emmonsiellopsis sp. PD_33]KAK2788544.1 hypothetical protein FQN52_006657 [Onygenales sp. PD_12]